MSEQITLDHLILFLNELIKLDPKAMTALFEYKTECNADFAARLINQVRPVANSDKHTIDIQGLLNGMFGTPIDRDWGPIISLWKSSLEGKERRLMLFGGPVDAEDDTDVL